MAGECPLTALWPASPTPAVRQEQPRTHNRECGSQPAYQSLITDVFQFRLHQCASYPPRAFLRNERLDASTTLTADIRAVHWPRLAIARHRAYSCELRE